MTGPTPDETEADTVTRRHVLQAAGAAGVTAVGGSALAGGATADPDGFEQWPDAENVMDVHVTGEETPVIVEAQLTHQGIDQPTKQVEIKGSHEDWTEAAVHELERNPDCDQPTYEATVPLPCQPVEANETADGWTYDVGLRVGEETVRSRSFVLSDQDSGEVSIPYTSGVIEDGCPQDHNERDSEWTIPGFTLPVVGAVIGAGGLFKRLRTD